VSMTCKQAQQSFDERIDGRLNESERAAFDEHLTACADCRREWQAYAGAWTALERQAGIEPSFGFIERTLRRLNEPEIVVRPRFWQPAFRWTVLAATVVVLSVGALVGHERLIGQRRADVYARVQQADYLEDFDVIASLDQINGGNQL
jgi:predicted anti-sigma-YlaC factor YlaD